MACALKDSCGGPRSVQRPPQAPADAQPWLWSADGHWTGTPRISWDHAGACWKPVRASGERLQGWPWAPRRHVTVGVPVAAQGWAERSLGEPREATPAEECRGPLKTQDRHLSLHPRDPIYPDSPSPATRPAALRSSCSDGTCPQRPPPHPHPCSAPGFPSMCLGPNTRHTLNDSRHPSCGCHGKCPQTRGDLSPSWHPYS